MWSAWIKDVDGFPRADWERIAAVIHAADKGTWEAQWSDAVGHWLARLRERLGAGYELGESGNFLVLAERPRRWRDLLLNFVERALATILRTLPGIARDDGFGKHTVLVFARREDYYEYVSYCYPAEGHFAASSGCFVSDGYGHFVFPGVELDEAEPVAAHELTHVCLAHLPIPSWLNEGLAVSLEHALCGSAPLTTDKARIDRHRGFWGADEIQEFWSGRSFVRPDEGCELSYELARYCVKVLSGDYERFVRFANEATASDGGDAAARAHYRGGLGGIMERFLGPGRWSPEPTRWETAEPGTIHGSQSATA